MTNRVSGYAEETPDDLYGDFFVVAGEYFTAGVTRDTARRIEAQLDRRYERAREREEKNDRRPWDD